MIFWSRSIDYGPLSVGMPSEFKFDIYGLNKWHFINFNCPFTECEFGMISSRYSSRIYNGLSKLFYYIFYNWLCSTFIWIRNVKSNSLIGESLKSYDYWRSNATFSYLHNKEWNKETPDVPLFQTTCGRRLLIKEQRIEVDINVCVFKVILVQIGL